MSLKRLLYGGLPQLGGGSYQSIVLNIAPSSLLAYWPLTETGGTTASDVSGNARHGAYSGVTLAQIAGPGASMGLAGLWDGVNDTCDVFSASLASAFNGLEGTLSLWFKIQTWATAANRHLLDIRDSGTANTLAIRQLTTTGSIDAFYRANSTVENIIAATGSLTTWRHVGFTWSKSADVVELYLDGISKGTSSTLGSWNAAIVSAAIGSGGGTFLAGYLAHCALWSTARTAPQMQTLATAR